MFLYAGVILWHYFVRVFDFYGLEKWISVDVIVNFYSFVVKIVNLYKNGLVALVKSPWFFRTLKIKPCSNGVHM